jgi:NADPH:quinone reductase-like Zn-dependent oxidoreductase
MASRSIKYIAPGKAKPLEALTSTISSNLEPRQILVRLKVTAINPADFKMIDEGQRVISWPIVPGMDGAGVVEAVGSGVEDFVPGDRVMGHFDPRSEHGGSYQTHSVVQKSVLAKFPPSWSMEEAASLG